MRFKISLVSLITLMIIFSLLMGGCLKQGRADKHLKHALDFVELQMLDEAVIELKNALRIKEKEEDFNHKPESFLLKSILYVLAEENKKAINELESGIETHGDRWNIHPLLASLYMREKKYNKAIAILEKLPYKDFGNTQLNIIKGMEYAEKGRYERALSCFERAKKEFSEQSLQFDNESGTLQIVRSGVSSILYDLMATNYEKVDQLDKALENYRQLAKLAPRYPAIKEKIAVIQYKLKLKGEPGNASILNSLGWAYYEVGEAERAESAYQFAIRNNPSLSMAYNNLGLIYYDRNKFNKAIPFLRKAVKLDNDNSAKMYALYNLGRIFRRQKDYQKAVDYLERAIELNPSYGPARREYKIAMMLLMLKSDSKQISLVNLGKAYNENGEIEAALNIFVQLAEDSSDDYRIYYNLGWLYFTKRRYDDAKENYDAALSIRADSWRVHNELANLYKINRKYEMALKEFEKALKNAPDDLLADIRSEMAAVYFEKGENDKAVALWKKVLRDKGEEYNGKIKKIINVLES
ncbi:MAG: tetratricopeptide repeat protein [Candidatus Auribacterota bacterium]|nr:tetratricopeptide repeat protein [Candidatus Auribacterota bacterium]